MVIVFKEDILEKDILEIKEYLHKINIRYTEIKGKIPLIYIEKIGDENVLSLKKFHQISDVLKEHDYLKSSRLVYKEDSVIKIANKSVGGGNFLNIGGPCSIESKDSLYLIAESVKKSGGDVLRGGAFKLRTSPYSFQGLGNLGLDILVDVGSKLSMPVVSEIVDPRQIEDFLKLDVIQVGARNMKNYELLKELGHINKPIILKRSMDGTIEELLQSAEYILMGGNENVILCERGIRTFERKTRNTLDISAVSVLKDLGHLPVLVDPSHGVGVAKYVKAMALASAAAGADGLMIETHNTL